MTRAKFNTFRLYWENKLETERERKKEKRKKKQRELIKMTRQHKEEIGKGIRNRKTRYRDTQKEKV